MCWKVWKSFQAKVVLATETLGGWLNGQTTDEAVYNLEKQHIDSKSEIYVGLLVARLSLLTTELDARRREHSSIVSELDKSRKIGSELRKKVSAVNADLLRCQKRHLAEVSRLTSMMTVGQKEELLHIAEKELVNIQCFKFQWHIFPLVICNFKLLESLKYSATFFINFCKFWLSVMSKPFNFINFWNFTLFRIFANE